MRPTAVFSHPGSAGHDTGAHPERAARLDAIEGELARHPELALERLISPPAEHEDLERVHTPEHLERVRRACEASVALDPDTVVVPASWPAALHAAGGAVALVDALLGGGLHRGLALHRPPGHHAEPDRAMGFCLLNNVAVAAAHALSAGAGRVLVLDWDVHHGNGTQAAFWTSSRVLFCSLHRWPFYPGTGAAGEVGEGEGRGHTLNLPVPAGTAGGAFLSLVRDVVCPVARAWGPDLVLVSAGYDAHRDDPLGGCLLADSDYGALAACVSALADELEVPLGFVLEGGYDLGALGRSVVATLVGAGGEGGEGEGYSQVARGVGEDPLAVRARHRLASLWPVLEGSG